MTPQMLDAMVASGASAEVIAAAWKAEMAGRSTSAKRMARKRARDAEADQVTQSDVCDVTCDGGDATPSTPAPSSPQTPHQPHPHTPVINTPRARGSRLAANFELPDDWRDWAMAERGWTEADADTEGASFADFWRSKPGRDALKLDWPATWRNWVRNSRRRTGWREREAAPVVGI